MRRSSTGLESEFARTASAGTQLTADCLVVLEQVNSSSEYASAAALPETEKIPTYVKPRRLLRWILGRDLITTDGNDLEASNVLRWATRCEAAVMYALGTIGICILGASFYSIFGLRVAATTLFSYAGAILVSLLVLRVSNSTSCVALHRSLNLFVCMLVVLNLTFPVVIYIVFGGGDKISSILLWTLLAPIAALFLTHENPVFYAALAHAARTALCTAVICMDTFVEEAALEDQPKLFAELGVLIFSNFAAPVFVAIAYWRSMDEFRLWHASMTNIEFRCKAQQATNAMLLSSVFPPVPAKEEVMAVRAPDEWYWMTGADQLQDCTMLQMDIKGFTALSSVITATELLDVVNAIFSSIDEAASIVGHVWKVETIGDCYKAVVGGFNPCPDHARRAMVLACALLEIVRGIASKSRLPLTVRCGVHSGTITGAVVGSLLPRYLVYGATCNRVNELEATAAEGCVQCSEETARLLDSTEWALLEGDGKGGAGEPRGAGSASYTVKMGWKARAAMRRGETGRRLNRLLRIFRASRDVGLGVPAGAEIEPDEEDEVESGATDAQEEAESAEVNDRQEDAVEGLDDRELGGAIEVEEVEDERAGGMQGSSSKSMQGGGEGAGTGGGPASGGAHEEGAHIDAEGSERSSSGEPDEVPPHLSRQCMSSQLRRSLNVLDAHWSRVTHSNLFATPNFSREGALPPTPQAAAVAARGLTGVPPPSFRVRDGDRWVLATVKRRRRYGSQTGTDMCSEAADGSGRVDSLKRAVAATRKRLSSIGGGVLALLTRHGSLRDGAERAGSEGWPAEDSRGRPPSGRTSSFGPVSSSGSSNFSRASSASTPGATAVAPTEGNRMAIVCLLGAVCFGSLVHCVVLLVAAAEVDRVRGTAELRRSHVDKEAPDLWPKAIAPAAMLLVSGATLWYHWVLRDATVPGVRSRVWLTLLMFCAPAAFMGSHDARHLHSCVVWSFFAVLIQGRGWGKRNYWRTLLVTVLVYSALIISIHVALSQTHGKKGRGGGGDGDSEDDDDSEDQDHHDANSRGQNEGFFADEWWVVVLGIVNQMVPTTVFLVPLAATAQQLWGELARNRGGLERLEEEVGLQGRLLAALVPAPICRRLMSGLETRIADDHRAASVLFVYVADVDEVMAAYGEVATIAWLNQVFAKLDACVSSWTESDSDEDGGADGRQALPSLTKVESFNNFYLAVSIEEGEDAAEGDDGPAEGALWERRRVGHAESAVMGAVKMVQAAATVRRPDAKETVLKVGVNSGPLCAGVISIHAPRWSIFGDTVNVGSRMASTSARCDGGRIHIQISDATARCMQAGGGFERISASGVGVYKRSELVEVKGKGAMQVWSLQDHRADKEQDAASDWIPVLPSSASASDGGRASQALGRVGTVAIAAPRGSTSTTATIGLPATSVSAVLCTLSAVQEQPA